MYMNDLIAFAMCIFDLNGSVEVSCEVNGFEMIIGW